MEIFCGNPHYTIVETADGSPTLQWQDIEKMHHSGGAYAETQMIYGRAVRESLQQGQKSFISVGLGLGYNEILILAESLKLGLQPKILSFESQDFLVQSFLENLKKPQSNSVHEKIFSFYQKDYPFDLRQKLLDLKEKGLWRIAGSLNESSLENYVKELDLKKYHCVLFDAFSSKSSPELWSEDFLKKFLQQLTAAPCVFATYACTGNLRRSLMAQNFEFFKEIGFQGKRHSSFAVLKL